MTRTSTSTTTDQATTAEWPVPDPRHLARVLVDDPELFRPVWVHVDQGDKSGWVVEVNESFAMSEGLGGGATRGVVRVLRGPDPHNRGRQRLDGVAFYNEVVRDGVRGRPVVLPRDIDEDGFLVRAGSIVPWDRAVALGVVPA